MRRLRLYPVSSIELEPVRVVRAGAGDVPGEGAERRVLVDEGGAVRGWARGSDSADPTAVGIASVRSDQCVYEALDAMLRAHDDVAVVLDDNGAPVGVLTWSAVVRDHLAHDPAAPALPQRDPHRRPSDPMNSAHRAPPANEAGTPGRPR
jgi:osmoprotectant transport system ATP-binding protein